jgi:hypothetical protein
MNTEYQIGMARMQEAIDNGEDLGRVVSGLANSLVPVYLSGAVSLLVGIYQHSKASGIKVPLFDPSMKEFASMSGAAMAIALTDSLSGTDVRLKGRQLSELATAAAWMRSRGVKWKAQSVIHNEPLDVRVVGLPVRKTETTVVRDAETQEIVSTTQIEQDMSPEVPQPQDRAWSK